MHVRRTIGQAVLAAALAASLTGCGAAIPSGDPAAELGTDLRGYKAPVGVMMGVDEKPHWAKAALSGFREVKMGDTPATLDQRDSVGGCAFTRPSAGDQVALVMVDSSPMSAPLFAISRTDVGARAENLINVYKNQGKTVVSSDAGKDQFEVVDVVVTERTKPVHLVLASGGGGVLFNVHLAPGAKVSRAAVIGAYNMAVANLDPSTPIEFLAGEARDSCRVAPLRTPADHWAFVRNARESPSSHDDLLAENYAGQRRWSDWHRASFGVPSEPGAIGANSAAHVLVGAVPASPKERAKYRPLKGATVILSRADHVIAGRIPDYAKLNDQLVRAAALQAAGGDLASLRPAGA